MSFSLVIFVVGLLVAAYAVPALLLVVLDRVRGRRAVPATEQIICRANPYPTRPSILGVGVLAVLYFYQRANMGESGRIVLGLFLVVLLINGRFAYVVLTSTHLRYRRSLLSPAVKLRLSELEAVRVGAGFLGAPSVSVVGTGSRIYELGELPSGRGFSSRLSRAIESSRDAQTVRRAPDDQRMP
jgi:hypothetical protein